MNADTLLGAAVGATLTLTILECCFWAFIAYSLYRTGKKKRATESGVALRTTNNSSDGEE